MAIQAGQTLGNYQIVRFLGGGAFGEVHLGEHVHLHTLAAIKVLSGLFSAQDILDFKNEARIIAAFKHPHIVRLLDFGEHQDGGRKLPFMVMEYADNGTLEARHLGSQVPLVTVVSYVKQIAEALQYAHNNKIIHRDIKPGNIFVGHSNEILVGDFGIAAIVHSTLSQKQQGFAGTPAYMAPEQIQMFPHPASDQYALAIMVYEWLSGTLPFDGTTLLEIQTKHLTVPPPSLRAKVPTISPDVEQVVFRALEKDYKQRYPSIRDFADALEKASNPPQPQPAVPPPNVGALVQPVSPPIQQPPGLPARERLYREGIGAQLAGDIERAAALWGQALSNQGFRSPSPIPYSQWDSLDGQLSKLLQEIAPQRIELKLQQAREAKDVGDWKQEINLWDQIISLKGNFIYHDWSYEKKRKNTQKERTYRDRATKNLEYQWLYEHAQQLINNGRRDEAKAALIQLWRFAPSYGDPSGLAKKAGTYVPLDPSTKEEWRSSLLPLSVIGMGVSAFSILIYFIESLVALLFAPPTHNNWFLPVFLGIFIISFLLYLFTAVFLRSE